MQNKVNRGIIVLVPIVSFCLLSTDTTIFDTINTQRQRLKTKLARTGKWRGRVVCIEGKTSIQITDILKQTTKTITIPERISSCVTQHSNEILVVTPNTIYAVNTTTFNMEIRLRIHPKEIQIAKYLEDGRFVVKVGGIIKIYKDWHLLFEIIGKIVKDIISLSDGRICVLSNSRTVTIWENGQESRNIDVCRETRVIELSPGTLLLADPLHLGFITVEGTNQVSLLKIKDGTFIIASYNQDEIHVYDGDTKRFSVTTNRGQGCAPLLVEPGVILWSNKQEVTLYDIEHRTVIGVYKCKGNPISVLYDN
jgi:WD40 repeat protein